MEEIGKMGKCEEWGWNMGMIAMIKSGSEFLRVSKKRYE
jgi:hypothetical protein